MPPNPIREYSTLPKSLLLKARIPGNVLELTCINGIVTRENYVPEVLDIYLSHITRAPPPPHPRPHAQPEEKNASYKLHPRALSAIASVKQGIHLALTDCPDPQAVYRKIRPHLPTLIDDWLEVCVWSPYPLEDTGTSDALMDPATTSLPILQLITQAGPQMRDEVLSANGIIKYSLGAFSIRKQSGLPFMSESWAQGHCPTALVLRHVLDYSEDNRQKAFDVLCGQSRESKFLATRIVENTYMRCQYLSQQKRAYAGPNECNPGYDHNDYQSGPETALFELETILSVVKTLCQQPILARRFMKSLFFTSFTYALSGWLTQKSDRVRDRKGRIVGFKMAEEVQALVEEYAQTNRRLSRAAHIAMVESGLVAVVLEGMQLVPWREGCPVAKTVASAFLRLKNLCYTHLTSPGKIGHQAFFLRGTAFESSAFLSGTGWELCYEALVREIKAGGAIPRVMPSLCDNIYCPERPSLITPYQKACSRCHTAVYCSQRCQEADWDLLHRYECRAARYEYEERKHVGNAHYTQKLRLEHGKRAAFFGYQHLQDQSTAGGEIAYDFVLFLTTQSYEFIPLLDYLQAIGLVEQTNDGPKYTPKHYLDHRIKEMIRYYLERDDLRLIAAEYPFGHNIIRLLTLIQLTTEPPSAIGAYDYVFKCCVAKVMLSKRLVSHTPPHQLLLN